MEQRSRRAQLGLSPGSNGSTFDFDELEREEMLRSGNSEEEKRALNNLALVTENVSKIEVKGSRRTVVDDDESVGPPGLEDSEVSENEECPDREVLMSDEETENAADIPLLVLPKEGRPAAAAGKNQSGRKKSTGRKLRMVKGMTVDSGAADNVIPRRMIKGKGNVIRPSPGSRRGVHYVSASNTRIPNEGECDFHFTTSDGQEQSFIFQIAEVNKALCAVSYLVDSGNQVIFDQDEATGIDTSRIINKKSGEVIQLVRDRNVWTIDAYIEDEEDRKSDFHRRG